MSSMAVASGGVRTSTLNPNAPLFIPAAYRQVEDFSAQWWELVKTTSWFRDHWFRQHQEQETFDGEDEYDVANLLPESFDLGITDEAAFYEAFNIVEQEDHVPTGLKKDSLKNGVAGAEAPDKEPELEEITEEWNYKACYGADQVPREATAVCEPKVELPSHHPATPLYFFRRRE